MNIADDRKQDNGIVNGKRSGFSLCLSFSRVSPFRLIVYPTMGMMVYCLGLAALNGSVMPSNIILIQTSFDKVADSILVNDSQSRSDSI